MNKNLQKKKSIAKLIQHKNGVAIMKKYSSIILSILYILMLTGCNKGLETMYIEGIMIDGVLYEKAYAMPAEIDESAIIGHVESYTDTIPEKNGETNISKDLIGAPYAKVEGGIALLHENEWYLCMSDETSGGAPTEPEETISFHDKKFNKSDLSEETIEWLEYYNSLSEKDQLAISGIPADLYDLCGYPTAEDMRVTEEIAVE